MLREHIPLKQGLRPLIQLSGSSLMNPQRAYSIKTRIKTTFLVSAARTISMLREHIPLKQGLRQIIRTRKANIRYLREHIPLKQGLRPRMFKCVSSVLISQRAYSIKTRIKTHLDLAAKAVRPLREHIPLKQGLRHSTSSKTGNKAFFSESIFH